jgi:hypothetical protein
MGSSINCPVPDMRDVKLHYRPNSHILWRGDAQQCINRILSCTRNEQQEASHNAEVFAKALRAGASEALVEEASPADYGAAMLNKASIEYFAPPVMHNSRKPPIMLRSL